MRKDATRTKMGVHQKGVGQVHGFAVFVAKFDIMQGPVQRLERTLRLMILSSLNWFD